MIFGKDNPPHCAVYLGSLLQQLLSNPDYVVFSVILAS
jgi:hypothetical protein